jgi:hypothetical protein
MALSTKQKEILSLMLHALDGRMVAPKDLATAAYAAMTLGLAEMADAVERERLLDTFDASLRNNVATLAKDGRGMAVMLQ